MKSSLLATKLYVPKLYSKLVKRSSLLEKLSNGLDAGCKVILVSAPAGYGKTTLVLEWINSINRSYSWISLDEGDNDQVRFLSYLIEGFRRAGVSIGTDTEKLISEPQVSTDILLTMVINDLSNSPEEIVLVLDDYHVIKSSAVHEIVKFLIEYLPSNVHLAITTREDPPIPLPRLRVRGQVTEIRVEDLRFNREETGDYFRIATEIKLKTEAVEAFTNRTEGWIAGIQLAALALKGYEEEEIDRFVQEFSGTHRYVIDYLVEEVLIRQSNEIKEFLCETSVLERMNHKLCDYITGRNDSKAVLQELEQANLFLIPLDGRREWYRYHHLFADSLRAELSEQEERLIHQKACKWFDNNGLREEAVKHAFKAGDIKEAVRIIENSVEELFKYAQLTTLVRWLDQLPETVIAGSEMLSVRKGWALFITGDLKRTIAYIYSLDKSFVEKATPHNKGLLLSLQALLAEYTGKGHAELLAAQALNLLEDWDPVARIATMNTLGKAQADDGRNVEADKTFRRAYEEGLKLGYTFITTLALLHLVNNLNMIGKRKEAVALSIDYLDGINAAYDKPLPYSGLIYTALSGLYYEGNELQKAKEYAVKGLELCKNLSLNWTLNSKAWLARIQHVLGEKTEAAQIIEEALQESRAVNIPRVTLKNEETILDLLIKEKKLHEASELAESWEVWLHSKLVAPKEQAALVYARLMIAKNNTGKALELLREVEEAADNGGRSCILITVFAQYSLCYYKKGLKEKAEHYIKKALKLAEIEEYYRALLDEGELILEIAVNSKLASDFTNRLKIYFNNETVGNRLLSREDYGSSTSEQMKSVYYEELIEQLSQREMELLKLIAEGLTNNEIAQKLYITINTAQWHISNIYSKLGVKNRTQAIAKARNLKLF